MTRNLAEPLNMSATKQLEDAVFFTALNLVDLEQRQGFCGHKFIFFLLK